MKLMEIISYEELLQSLSDLSVVKQGTENMQELIELKKQIDKTVSSLSNLDDLSRENLASIIQENPDAVPILASCVGLGREKLRNQLRHRLGSSGWVTLARTKPIQIIEMLDKQFNLLDRLNEQLNKDWTFADVLMERYLWSSKSATSAQGRGRSLEDQVEDVVKSLGLTYRMRCRFTGRGGNTAPCDLAIPEDRDPPLIVGAAKGFNSTGSKLTDAVREIEDIANVRLPKQFVFAFIDGIGWKRREADLKRIYDLWKQQYIDGIYTLVHMERFKKDLRNAAIRHGLLDK